MVIWNKFFPCVKYVGPVVLGMKTAREHQVASKNPGDCFLHPGHLSKCSQTLTITVAEMCSYLCDSINEQRECQQC